MPFKPINTPAASSQVKVRNLTPLDIWVEAENAGGALRPFDEVVAGRPSNSKFKLEVNGVPLGLLAAKNQNELTISPETLSELERPQGAPGAAASAILENQANVDVIVNRLDPQGMPVKLFKLKKTRGVHYRLSGSAGDIHTVRNSFTNDLLAVFVLGTQEPELEVAITDKFLKRVASGATTVVQPVASDDISVTNLTPLDVRLHSADGKTIQLESLATLKVERPPFAKFAAEVNGVRLGVVEFDPTAEKLELKPSHFRSLAELRSLQDPLTGSAVPRNIGSAIARFQNASNGEVKIYLQDHAGTEIERLALRQGGSDSITDTYPGAVYVVRDSDQDSLVEPRVLDMCVVGTQSLSADGKYQQALTITGDGPARAAALAAGDRAGDEVELSNFTPLDLTVTDQLGAESTIPSLGTVKAKRPAGLRFLLKRGGFVVGSVMPAPGTKKATIDPSLLRTAPKPPSGGVYLLSNLYPTNQAGVDVKVYKIDESGQEQLQATVGAGRDGSFQADPGDVFIVREYSTGEVLHMFVFGPDPVEIKATFPRKLAEKLGHKVKVTNLTPLALDIEGGGKSTRLEAFEEAKITRHGGGLFGVNRAGLRLLDLRVDAETSELKIAPSLFRSIGSNTRRDPVTGAYSSMTSSATFNITLRNLTGTYVDLLWVDHSGQEVRKQTLGPDLRIEQLVGSFGDVYVARRTFTSELLAMFVFGGALNFDPSIFDITNEFCGRMAGHSLKLPVIPGGQLALYGQVGSETHKDRIPSVALLGAKREKPDRRCKEYILISERLANAKPKARFNTRKNVNTRSVTITGVELIWSAEDDSYGLMGYQGANVLDIEELEMFADRVVIASELVFPGTNLKIHARELELTGAGKITTTPMELSSSERARSPNRTSDGLHPAGYVAEPGLNGEPGGGLKILVGKLAFPNDGKQKFCTKGSNGQKGEEGGLKSYKPKSTKPGQPTGETPDVNWVTNEDVFQAFDAKITTTKTSGAALDHFDWPDGSGAIAHKPRQMVTIRRPTPENSYIGTTDFPNWKESKPGFPDGPIVSLKVVFCRTDFWAMTNWLWVPDGPLKHEWRDVTITSADQALQEPYKPGANAIFSAQDVTGPTRQRPGDGQDAYSGGRPGDGGHGGSIQTNFGGYLPLNMDGGEPGDETPAVPGGPKGKPNPAYWMDVAVFFGGGTPNYKLKDVTAEDGQTAPPVRGTSGLPGSFQKLEVHWMTAEIVDAVIACAQDAYRNGRRDLAMELLDPYYAELRTSAASEELQSQFVTINAMRANLLRNTDFYGNPPGWIPRLSLDSTFSIFNAVRDSSAELLYFAETMGDKYEKIDQSSRLAVKGQAVVHADISRNRAALKIAYGHLKEARAGLEDIEREVGLKQDRISKLKMLAEQKALDKVKEQRIFKGVMKVVGGALKLVPVGQPYVGLGADVVSGVGDFDWTNPAKIPDQVSATFGKVGTLTNKFIAENEDLLVDDLLGPGPTDQTTRLAEQLRLAENAVTAQDAEAAEGRKHQLQKWEEANKTELGTLNTDQAKLAELEATIKTFEPDEEAERIMGLIKKKYGDAAGGQIGEALLERRQDLIEAVNKATVKLDAARGEAEKKALLAAAEKLGKLKDRAADLTEKLAQGTYAQAQSGAKREAKKKQYTETVGRLKKIGDGISGIGVGVGALMSSPTTADADVQNLSALLLQSEFRPDYERLLLEAKELAGKQAQVMAKFNAAQQGITSAIGNIATNMGELDALSHQRQSLSQVLDVRVKRYLKGMEARARDTLRWAIYALIQSYRYENLMDVGEEFYNADKLVTQIRKLEAAKPEATTGRVAGEAELAWPKFKEIDDTVFKKELTEMGVKILEMRQKYKEDVDNSAPIALSSEQLKTLGKTAKLTFNLVTDFDISVGFEAIRARIVDIDLTELVIALKPPKPPAPPISSIRADFVHSGQSIIRGHDKKYYYFRQDQEHDPISWGFTFATDTKIIKKDSKDNQEDLAIVKQFMTTVSDSTASQLIKFKEYYPSLFSDINLSLNLRDPKDIDIISSVKFTVKYRLAGSGRG